MNRNVFYRQLRYWSFHVPLNALPGSCIALFYLELWKSPSALAAMTAVIGMCILAFTILTSLDGPLAVETHVLSRALKIALKIRGWISGISLVLLPKGGLFLMPDFWCGWLVAGLIDTIATLSGSHGRLIDTPNLAGLPEIFATSLLVGMTVLIFVMTVTFFVVLFLQSKDRRNLFLRQGSRHPSGF